MKKSNWNFIIDTLLLLLTAFMTGKGLLLKYVLIPGRERQIVYGSNVELQMFGLDRHQWGTIHLYAGYAMIALVILHIILHWNVIPSMYRKLIAWRGLRTGVAIAYVVVCLLLVFFPFMIEPTVLEGGEGRGLGGGKGYGRGKGAQRQAEQQPSAPAQAAEGTGQTAPPGSDAYSEKGSALHGERGKSSGIKGYMTLGEAAGQYGVSPEELARELGIREAVSSNARLGQLRQQYNFTMEDVATAGQRLRQAKQK
ncbi:MAG: DUF4405 domain-containing protein [Candidatus Sumerlaeia bacterium]|nr:DUF4405 domain-containing protein [Candidatus Sumerlaeia bacterium]